MKNTKHKFPRKLRATPLDSHSREFPRSPTPLVDPVVKVVRGVFQFGVLKVQKGSLLEVQKGSLFPMEMK